MNANPNAVVGCNPQFAACHRDGSAAITAKLSTPALQRKPTTPAPPVYRPVPSTRPAPPPVYSPKVNSAAVLRRLANNAPPRPVQGPSAGAKIGPPPVYSPSAKSGPSVQRAHGPIPFRIEANAQAPVPRSVSAAVPLAFMQSARASSVQRFRASVVQAKILKDIDTLTVSGGDTRVITTGMFDSVIGPFIYGQVAGHPNQTIAKLFEELDLDAFGTDYLVQRVAKVRKDFWDWVDVIIGKDWGTVKQEWKDKDDKIEKLYMDLKKNKVPVPDAPNRQEWEVTRGHGVEIGHADSGDAWRARGAYGGTGSWIPRSFEHYAVGTAKHDKLGPERIYVQQIHLTQGGSGVRAFYSATHGDTRSAHAKASVLISNATIGGARIVAPWDPYQH